MKKLFIYHRVSTKEQIEGSGLDRQAALIERYVTKHNLLAGMEEPEATVLSDPGISAYKGHNLERDKGKLGLWVYQSLNGMWDGSHLVLESLDRFSRLFPFEVLKHLMALLEHDITIHDIYNKNIINNGNAESITKAINQSIRANDESVFKGERIREGWADRRETAKRTGTIITSKRPTWIDIEDKKYVLNYRAAIVQEIFRLYQTGIGTPTIAKILQKKKGDNWKWVRGWSGELVHKILTNPRVTGKILITEIVREYSENGKPKPATKNRYEMDVYPIVIAQDEFNLVQELLKSRRPSQGRVTTNKDQEEVKHNLFTGIFRCALCGGGMFHNIVKSKRKTAKGEEKIEEYRYIRCIGQRDDLCDNMAMDYNIIEDIITGRVKGMDFSQLLEDSTTNAAADIIRLKIEESKRSIEENQTFVDSQISKGRKVAPAIRQEIFDEIEKIKTLEAELTTFEVRGVDTNVLTSFNSTELFNIHNYPLRSRYERELGKLVNRITLLRDGKNYIAQLFYKNQSMLKHILIMVNNKKKGYHLAYDLRFYRTEDSYQYGTDSFVISIKDGEDMPKINFINDEDGKNVPINYLDYTMLQNYIITMPRGKEIFEWMKRNVSFLFTT